MKANDEMNDGVWEDSEDRVHNEPAQNEYEKAKWNSNGYQQSGFVKGK